MNAGCTEKIKIQRFEQDVFKDFEDIVLSEKSFTLFLNGNPITKLTCTNKDIKELTAGCLLCEHHVRSLEELRSVSIDNESGNVYAETAKTIDCTNDYADKEYLNINYAAVVASLREFQEMSPLFKETASAHSAALLDLVRTQVPLRKYHFHYFSEDMGRYNAVEKAIGKAFLNNFYLSQAMLVVSSRMPLELIQKIYRTGITAVASISAPTLESIRFAKENKITLAGMFRENRINIYAH